MVHCWTFAIPFLNVPRSTMSADTTEILRDSAVRAVHRLSSSKLSTGEVMRCNHGVLNSVSWSVQNSTRLETGFHSAAAIN